MKNIAVIVTAVIFLASFSADAQMQQKENNQQDQKQGMMMQGRMQQNMMRGMMMQGGMQQNMMGGMMCPMHHGMMGGQQMPMRKYMMMVHMLPNMQEPLSLSQDQVEQLIDMRTSFKKQQIDHMGELTKKRMSLQNMMMNDASGEDIKTQLQECSSTVINMKVMAYETANNMKSVLTNEQRESMQNMMKKMQDGMQQGGMQQGGMQEDDNHHMN